MLLRERLARGNHVDRAILPVDFESYLLAGATMMIGLEWTPMRIPKQAGHLFRIDVGHRSDLIPARVPR
jgi:hypothetical protein